MLPKGWKQMIHDIAEEYRDERLLLPKHSSCREANEEGVNVANVDGITLKRTAPWLYELYATKFVELAQYLTDDKVVIAKDDLHAAVLNIQNGTTMRYEAHVDTNPIQGILYVTTHTPGEGGELVVANSEDCYSIQEIEKNSSRIYPVSGHIVFFDARKFSHYVPPLRDNDKIRIVVAMNFYTSSCPESMRPHDLSIHLKGY
ncbi:2OG-Fe(II) oxygenase [Changchengzhania lutea]|uniref:2OG-Fe(II) oxygenase n=1 Tax=Changchengzhania lutea TaxID=2049305 RepID=UPI001C8F7012|nr:2OG-Fe(II) oxygenase [Changchengzhania lutea]